MKSAPSVLLCRVALTALLLWLSGCAARNAMYRFEPHASPVFTGSEANVSTSPQIGVSPSGALFVLGVYGSEANQHLGLAISHNAGDTFEPPVAIPSGNSVHATGEASPNLGVTSTAIYALWQQNSSSGGSDLVFSREPFPGMPFEKPIPIVQKTNPSFNGFGSLGVAPNGDIFSVWLDGRSPGPMRGTFSVYLARSTDRGKSFGANIEVASGACPCCRPRLAFGGDGKVYVFWRKVFDGQIRDIVASVSRDHGQTFAPFVRIAHDNWKLNGCPESGPAATTVGNRVYVAWMTEGNKNHPGVELSWTDDAGKSFTDPVQVSNEVLDANHPSLASNGSQAFLVFQARDPRKDNGWSNLRPYMVTIDRSAISKPVAIPSGSGSISYPVVTADAGGRIFAAWTESGNNTTQVFLSRGRWTDGKMPSKN